MTLRIRARRNSGNFELLAGDVVIGVHTDRRILEDQRAALRRRPAVLHDLVQHFRPEASR